MQGKTTAGSFSPLQESLAAHASEGMVQQLQAMGFTQHSAAAALMATHHSGATHPPGMAILVDPQAMDMQP
jgi:uncharacterized UBP type Zn finger protein